MSTRAAGSTPLNLGHLSLRPIDAVAARHGSKLRPKKIDRRRKARVGERLARARPETRITHEHICRTPSSSFCAPDHAAWLLESHPGRSLRA
ncbi:uncharacterized protein DFL_007965 [Arthrobotrys flagrans]|uniref:Uncharacterized protein n=1 Tax=Arthrobotrys flagrans TaxID=97331 RepID=A0A436ZX74_ARTFL|nr:hypothetical protein DFL_007965 [Arthrobotrys flagrans]